MDDPVRGLELTDAQHRLWLAQEIDPSDISYALVHAFRLRGPLDRDRLEAALRELPARHAALRIAVLRDGEEPVQVVREDVVPDFAALPLDLGPDAGEVEICAALCPHLAEPFDLERAPLFRARLFELGPQDHVLALVLHHIVADGWSVALLTDDLAQLYEAGPPAAGIAGSDAFARFARREGERAEDVAYWRTRLAGAGGALRLPVDRARPARPSRRGGAVSARLGEDEAARVAAFAAAHGVTPFMAMLSAFEILLHRYSGSADFLVGIPLAGRSGEGDEATVGMFVNTVMARARLADDMPVRDLLAAVRDETLDAMTHQSVPFSALVEAATGTPGGAQPVQVLFTLQGRALADVRLAGLSVEPLNVHLGGSKFDLSLDVAPHGSGYRLELEYAEDLFERATAERILANFGATLRDLAVGPAGRTVGEIEVMTPQERRLVIHGWNDTAAPFDRAVRIEQLFERRAAATPHATALVTPEGAVTFEELRVLADTAARRVAASGARAGEPVGVLLHRSVEAVAALLGVMKAGCPYVPLDPAHPDARLAALIEIAGCRSVLTSAALAARLPATVRALDIAAPAPDAALPAAADLSSEDLAYIIFTSGSTGTPKGVEGPHRAAINRFTWMWEAYPFGPGEVACQKTSLGFVDSIWEIFGPLLAGVPLVLVPDEVMLDPDAFLATLAAHRVTRLVLVPSLLRVLLDHAPDLGARLRELRLWSASGEPLPTGTVERFRAAVPHARLLNIYGSSEVTADVTAQEVAGPGVPPPDAAHSAPIGRPIANARLYLLDGALRPVPLGAEGQIHVAGECVARGYWRRPDLTAERFLPDPFDPSGTGRLFATGDLGRFAAPGALRHLGRADNQVKVQGVRIEIGEVEAALAAVPGVADAAVTVRGGEPVTLAAHVFAADPAIDARRLRQALAARLPSYMIPSAFHLVAALPHLPSGKVDRQALAAGLPAAAPSAPVPAPLDGADREAMAAIWREVLKVEAIDPALGFFEQGGHSLLAMQAISRIRRTFGVDVSIRDFFDAPTIEGLLEAVSAKRRAGGTVAAPAIAVRRRGPAQVDQLLADLDTMSSDDLERLLEAVKARRGS